MGFLGGYVLNSIITYHIPYGAWQPVSMRGEKAERILGAREYGPMDVTFDIQTDQGNMYRFTAEFIRRLTAGKPTKAG
jgi:hypothetical protein